MDSARIVYRPQPSISPQEARDVRARVWVFLFECFHRHAGKEDSPAPVPDNPERRSTELRADKAIVPGQ